MALQDHHSNEEEKGHPFNPFKFFPSWSRSKTSEKDSIPCTIEEFVAKNERFCACPPGTIPAPRGYEIHKSSESINHSHEQLDPEFINTKKILAKHKISPTKLQIISQYPKRNPDEASDVLIVSTDDVNVSKWSTASNEIRQIYLGGDDLIEPFTVKIRNPSKMCVDVSTLIPASDHSLGAIEQVEPAIYKIVEKDLDGIWTSVAFHMRGPTDSKTNLKPTILVFCRFNSRADFAKVQQKLEDAIKPKKLSKIKLHVEILPGQNYYATGAETLGNKHSNDLAYWREPPPPNIPRNGAWERERGGDWKKKAIIDEFGLGLDGPNVVKLINMVYPTKSDRTALWGDMKSYLRDNPNKVSVEIQLWKDTLTRLQEFENAGPIGKVIYASGLRTTKTSMPRRLDWALIEPVSAVASALGKNHPPARTLFGNSHYFRNQYCADVPKHTVEKIGAYKVGEVLYREGRTTVSFGEVGEKRRKVNWDGVVGTCFGNEIEAPHMDFATYGDSGSWVVNGSHELVGLLHGKHDMSGGFDFGFFTPIQDILNDIKDKTKGDITLP